MATAAQPFIASARQTRKIYVSNTSLFDIAARYLGNALLWTYIAEANGLTDPWITPLTTIFIPNVVSTSTPTGILGL